MKKCCIRNCDREGVKKIGGNLRCFFHSKVLSARITSQRRGLATPSFQEIEQLFLNCNSCPNCGVEFSYHVDPSTQKRRNRASLQHNDDGTFSVLCTFCNAMDANHIRGLNFVSDVGKFCPKCKEDLPWEKFHLKGVRGRGSTYCIECNKKDCKERRIRRSRA